MLRQRLLHPGALETALKLHVRDNLCARRGWDPAECRLEIPLAGRRSIVRVVVGPGGRERVVLRLFLAGRQAEEWQALRRALDLFAEHCIPAPRHLHVKEDFAGSGVILVEEEFVAGSPLHQTALKPPVVAAVAQTVGLLHAVRADHWGEVTTPKRHGHFTAWRGRLSNRLRALALHLELAPPRAQRREVSQWARGWVRVFGEMRGFSLTHDKLNPGNVMVTPEPRAVLIDVGSARWDSAAKDLVQLREEAFAADEPAWKAFLEIHGAAAGPLVAEETRRVTPFFEVYYHVAECAIAASRLRKAERGRARGSVEQAPEKIRRHWRAAMEVVASQRPATPERSAVSLP
jgi:hypothetical protein